MIRLRACERGAPRGVLAAAAALSLALLVAGGCGPEGNAGESDAPAPAGSSVGPSMTAEGYVAHIAALTIAVEEGLSGDAAVSRAIELGGGRHSREVVEDFARTLRSRPETWVEIEREVDTRIGELRGSAGNATGGGEQ